MIVLQPIPCNEIFKHSEKSEVSGEQDQRKDGLTPKVIDSSHRVFEQEIEQRGNEDDFPHSIRTYHQVKQHSRLSAIDVRSLQIGIS